MSASDASGPPGRHPRPLAGFNEAEACLPRMRRQTPKRNLLIGSGFNEAEACLPRMPASNSLSAGDMDWLQ